MSDQTQVLSAVTHLCSSFFEDLDGDELLSRIIETSVRILNCERGTVFLADQTEGRLRSLIATGMGSKKIKIDATEGIAGHVYRTNLPIITNDAASDPRFFADVDKKTGFKTKSILSVPLRTPEGTTLGVIEILNRKEGEFSKQDLEVLQLLAFLAAAALEHRKTVSNLKQTSETFETLHRERRKITGVQLKSTHPMLQELYSKLPIYSQSDGNILIEGESGTGKEVVSQLIHFNSDRKNHPFVAINCASIPESLIEAELFGVVKGAATGTDQRKGKFVLANRGTILLDEVGELPLSAQAKLLRVLQEKTVTPVGSDADPIPVDFRVVAATNRDLEAMIKEGTFREDLYYRLNVITFHLPPLRERLGDLEDICQTIIEKLASKRGRYRVKKLSPGALDRLRNFSWPGNIRQLQNKLENALIMSEDRELLQPQDFHLEERFVESKDNVVRLNTKSDSPGNTDQFQPQIVTLKLKEAKDSLEKQLIGFVLKQTSGNKSAAARTMGITREGLRQALKKAA